jgi:putative Holliday junction resolvase
MVKYAGVVVLRIIAIDYGDARTGIAVSDPTGTIAGETFTIHEKNANALANRIAELAKERGADKIVMGLPRNMNGTEGPRAEKSRTLAHRLETLTGIGVILWDERLTTASAHLILNQTHTRGAKRKAAVDALAAALILEGYLRSLP